MKLSTYVNFRGCCEEAFRYYEKHLNATIGSLMKFSEMPGDSHVGPEWQDAILHGRIFIGGEELMAADIATAEPMRSAYLSLRVESDEEAERVFAALSDGGQVFMPLEETFFATRFGQLRDRFGLNWMIIHERPMPGA